MRMNAKKYLQQIEKFSCYIEHKKLLLKEISSKLSSVPSFQYSEDKISGGNKKLGFDDYIIKKIELENEINADILRYEQLKNEITNKIHKLDNVLYINILFKHYVQLKDFDEIAKETYHELGYIYNMHIEALKDFSKSCEEM